MSNFFSNKRVLVTGGAGTVGQELIRQLLDMAVSEVRALDNNESGIFFLAEQYRAEPRLNAFFNNICDFTQLKYLCRGVDIIFHCAALKHVVVSELSPLDAVKVNVDGTNNVLQVALESDTISRVIYTSSDKAVNPTNVMGTSKLLGERLVTSALNRKSHAYQVFSNTRFGNVIGSKGSVVPIFYNQIRSGKPLTITDERMTRFIMTIPQAASLVLGSCQIAKGGEVFVTKMPVVKIIDLAKAMIKLLAPKFGYDEEAYPIEYIGAKSGEKLYEELMTQEEVARAVELEQVFAIKPAFEPIYETINYKNYIGMVNASVNNPYISAEEKIMTIDEICGFLVQHRVLDVLDMQADR